MANRGGRPRGKKYPYRVYTRLDRDVWAALMVYCDFHCVTPSEALRDSAESYLSAIISSFERSKT